MFILSLQQPHEITHPHSPDEDTEAQATFEPHQSPGLGGEAWQPDPRDTGPWQQRDGTPALHPALHVRPGFQVGASLPSFRRPRRSSPPQRGFHSSEGHILSHPALCLGSKA